MLNGLDSYPLDKVFTTTCQKYFTAFREYFRNCIRGFWIKEIWFTYSCHPHSSFTRHTKIVAELRTAAYSSKGYPRRLGTYALEFRFGSIPRSLDLFQTLQISFCLRYKLARLYLSRQTDQVLHHS